MVFLNICGPPAQIITSHFGPRATLILGTLCKSLGLIIAGWGSQPWHLIICQGILFGSGASFTYVVSILFYNYYHYHYLTYIYIYIYLIFIIFMFILIYLLIFNRLQWL